LFQNQFYKVIQLEDNVVINNKAFLAQLVRASAF
jgi:hypothetical protein